MIKKDVAEKIDFEANLKVIKACLDQQDKEYFTKAEMYDILNSIYNGMNNVYSACMKRISNVVDETNTYISEHGEKHMPNLDKTHVKAILSSAGIDKDFEMSKEPMECQSRMVWASVDALKSLKIEVK